MISLIGDEIPNRPANGLNTCESAAADMRRCAGIRQVVPTGVNAIGLQLGYFASYIFLFCLGIAAWRYDWLRQLEWKHARPWIITLPIAWLSMPAVGALVTFLNGSGKSDFSGGLSWMAIAYAFWEPFIAWGLIAAWLLVRRYASRNASEFLSNF